MAVKIKIETREERIDRTMRGNPGKSIELCAVVVDSIWEQRRELIEKLIPERFKDASMTDLGYLEPLVTAAVDDMLQPVKANDIVGIILTGQPGSGKTHAAYAVIRMLMEKNPEFIAYFDTYSQIMQDLRSEFLTGGSDDIGCVWDKLNNDSGMYPGLLMIDDFCAQKPTDFEIDKMTAMIDRRVNDFQPFLITTNVDPERFAEVFGERMASRLTGYCKIIKFEDNDNRIK